MPEENVLCRHNLSQVPRIVWVLSSAVRPCCQFGESNLFTWQEPALFRNFHGFPLVNNCVGYNSVPVQEVLFCVKRGPTVTLFPSLVIWRLYWKHLHKLWKLSALLCSWPPFKFPPSFSCFSPIPSFKPISASSFHLTMSFPIVPESTYKIYSFYLPRGTYVSPSCPFLYT